MSHSLENAAIMLTRQPHYWRGAFSAMANPCEVLLETEDAALASELTRIAADEAQRIERKFSRYRDDSIVQAINRSQGESVSVDKETAQLIEYGATLWRLSEGAFDLTSGVFRRIWKFDGQNRVPTDAQVSATLECIGWQRVLWEAPTLRLAPGMELDFGGIGKEYAVDRVAALLRARADIPMLVNFGGDLCAAGPSPQTGAWQVGIESVHHQQSAQAVLNLRQGALATSGDTRRALVHEGRRYGHIIDARTGWPAIDAPRSITVSAATCSQAGTYTTLAMLHGASAEAFLDAESVQYWCLR